MLMSKSSFQPPKLRDKTRWWAPTSPCWGPLAARSLGGGGALPSLGPHSSSAGGTWCGRGRRADGDDGRAAMSQQRYCSSQLPSAPDWLLPGRASAVVAGGSWQDALLRANLGLGWGALVPTRTQNFHHFLKLALTKNPKKRPTAEKLLQVGGRGWGWGGLVLGSSGQGPTCAPLDPPAPIHNPAAPSGSAHTAVGQGQ